MIQDTPLMVAKHSGTILLCKQGQGEFCQGLILKITPSGHFCYLTYLVQVSIPAYAIKASSNDSGKFPFI
jgi:hypothetical protein